MFASTKQSGNLMAFPDTCQVPSPAGPVPTPFPNTAMLNQATGSTCTQKIKIVQKEAVTKATTIPQSTGDEAGSAGGVVSGMIKGPAKFTSYSQKLFLEGQPAVFLGCVSAQNGNNANAPVGNQIAPSQTKVMIGG